ncbi:MAG TPA: 2TM domain-containing protein [Burkholderiaceae bacterium]|nr:2TM domain-containing protein [Burkholderiaceae bacterium]
MNSDSRLSPDTTSEAYRQARRRVRALRGWHIHAFVYACVIGGLWLLYGFGAAPRHVHLYPWPLAPMLGWGLGLAIHGFVVWIGASGTGRNWEERKIRELMQRG